MSNSNNIAELKKQLKEAKELEKAKKKLLTADLNYGLIETILKSLKKPDMEVEIKKKEYTIIFRTKQKNGKFEVDRERLAY